MDPETRYLSQFLTPERLARIETVLSGRTRNLSLVLEDVTDPHNVAACLRSAEALGVQDVHVIAGRSSFGAAHKVTQGTDKWLTLRTHRSPADCVKTLKSHGMTLAVGALDERAVPIQDLDFSRPVALAFCNEHSGVSSELLALADHVFYIPMLGFAQSFNISVASAIGLYFAVSRRVKIFGTNGDLPEEDLTSLRALWIHKSVPLADAMLDRYRKAEEENTEDTPRNFGEDSGELCSEDSGELPSEAGVTADAEGGSKHLSETGSSAPAQPAVEDSDELTESGDYEATQVEIDESEEER